MRWPPLPSSWCTGFAWSRRLTASKAAVRSFDQALAREARRRNVRVLDARPPHTETGLAEHPLAGTAPRMPRGIAPEHVATVICDALELGTNDLPSTSFET